MKSWISSPSTKIKYEPSSNGSTTLEVIVIVNSPSSLASINTSIELFSESPTILSTIAPRILYDKTLVRSSSLCVITGSGAAGGGGGE